MAEHACCVYLRIIKVSFVENFKKEKSQLKNDMQCNKKVIILCVEKDLMFKQSYFVIFVAPNPSNVLK